jgi:hypothetical protein
MKVSSHTSSDLCATIVASRCGNKLWSRDSNPANDTFHCKQQYNVSHGHEMPEWYAWNSGPQVYREITTANTFQHKANQQNCLGARPSNDIALFNTCLGAFAKLRREAISFILPIRPSVRPYGTTQLRLDGFSRKFDTYFSKICWENSSFIKI